MADNESYGSRSDLVRRRGAGSAGAASSSRGSQDTSRSGQQMYQPGTPIGYLAARGTPYEKKYFTKKLGFCCLFLAPPVLAVVGVITLVPVLWAIARHALHTAQLHVYESNITAPGNTSFPITIEGQVKKTGIFPAHLYFRKPVDVYWRTRPTEDEPLGTELHLGNFKLASIGAAAGHGRVKQATTFFITDEDGFGTFAQWLVSEEEFTWQVRCPEVHAEGFSFFPVYKQLEFVKDVIFKGINNFEDIHIIDLQLPGDDPAGGITAVATATLVNPSPFGVAVGTLNLALYYKGLYLGPVSVHGLNLTAGLNTATLRGRVVPYADNATALNILGELFTNYINSVSSPVQAIGVSTQLANGETVSWLQKGITALVAQIPFVPPTPINPIKGIAIDYISLVYKQDLPYNPDVFSNSLVGTFGLPFGFSLNITELAAQLNIFFEGAPVGTVYGPFSNSSTNIQVLSSGETSGSIDLTLAPSQLVLPNTTLQAREELIKFQNAFTYSSSAGFTSNGSARAVTDTPVGRILLNGIGFDVATGLAGLAGLTTYPTIINTVDVTGGTADAVSLAVGLTTINPSNINITAGDATFNLVNQVILGNATLPNLNLKIGRNDINSTAFFDPNRDPRGLETLNRFISGLDTNLNITGSLQSSKVESLAPTLAGIRLNATLPGLRQNLARSANLTVLDTTGITDDFADSHVSLLNPFSSELTITHIRANATSHGIFIAHIDTALNFPALGNQVTTSPVVPLSLNLYPPDLFALLRALVLQSGQDPAYLDGLVGLAGFTLNPTTDANSGAAHYRKREQGEKEAARQDSFVLEDDNEMAQLLMGTGSNPGALLQYDDDDDLFADAEEEDDGASSDGVAKAGRRMSYDGAAPPASLEKRANIYAGFDITQYVGKAFSSATANLEIVSDAVIGEYGTTLTFSQNDVPLGTDETLFKLLPVLALPIVQRIVDSAVLNVDRVTITDARPTSFSAALQGALTNAGPFDGVVEFPEGLTIYYQGQALTTAAFPNVSLVGDIGSSLNVMVEGQIPDVGFFTTFLQDAIRNPSFIWNIRGENIRVSALGIVVPNVTINKNVQLTGLNGLQGQVIINSFDVPSNDPAGGLHLTAVSTINNPAQVGVSLTAFGTMIMANSTTIGPAASDGAFTLQALAVTQVPLVGRIQQQTTDGDIAALGNVLTNFVHNQNSPLQVMGMYAGPSDVEWLNNGIKALNVQVMLPSQDFQVIRLVSINQLSLFFTIPTAYAPMSDTTNTTANFFLPFSFPLAIDTVAGPFIARYNDADMAVLNIPTSPTLTDVEARVLTLMFTNVPFSVYKGQEQTFSQFVADVTKNQQVTFNLHGMATGLADTAAGKIPISDIPFDLNTNILGLQNLASVPAQVTDLDVVHGFPTYLEITVMTQLVNPSDITIGAGTIQFAALFQNNVIGAAVINNVLLVPGVNNIPTQINYMPVGAANVQSGQTLLQNYVQNISSDAVVQGTTQTTPIPSLLQGLSGIQLTATIPPLMKLIVIQAALEVPTNIAQTAVAMASVMIANPFTASINIINLQAQAVYQGITIGRINQDLGATNNIIHAPGKVTTQSQQVPITLDLNPKTLIRFIEAAAATANVGLGPLPPFFQEVLDLPDTTTTIVPTPDPNPATARGGVCYSGNAFDTLGAVLELLKPLTATIPIQSTVKIDDYQTDLNFVQSPVPVATDDTALYLIGPAGAPLIQLVVNMSTLTVSMANATAITSQGFAASLAGALLTNAPADAYIEFTEPIQIDFMGTTIAEIALPPLCSQNPVGIPDLRTNGQLTILNEDAFEQFAYYILTEPNFQWFLHSNKVRVRALNIIFDDVILEKTIQLDAFNGLPGIVITSFDAPSDGPGPRINIVAQAPIYSPASLGVELGTATFDVLFQGSNLGQISSIDLFLAAKATTLSNLQGFLSDQRGNNAGLANLGILFSQFLAGQNSTLTVRGFSVVTPASGGQPVVWLTNAFKRFETNVILPGHIYQIIYSITLSDLTASVLNPADSYTIVGSNNQTVAMFANPFGFGLTPLEAGPMIMLTYGGPTAAVINLPLAPVQAGTSRGPTDMQPLQLSFRNQNIVADDHAAFQAFLAKLADTDSATFGLQGTTSVVAGLVIGNPTITGIPFNVTSSLRGINSFNRVAGVSNVSVDSGTPDYIGIDLIATLENPSNLTLFTNNLALPVRYTSSLDGAQVIIGRATIPTLGLIPGTNNINSLFEFMQQNNNSDQQAVLTDYLQSTDLMTQGMGHSIPLLIEGLPNLNPPLSPYDSLEPALEGVTAAATLQGIGTRIAVNIRAYITLSTLLQGIALQPTYIYAELDAKNDLPVDITLNHISTTVTEYNDPNNVKYAMFDFDFTGANAFTLPAANSTGNPSGIVTSPKITNILLPQGLFGSLPLIGHNTNIANVIQATIDGQYFIPGLKYEQHNINTTYLIDTGLGVFIPINAIGALEQIIMELLGGNLNASTISTLLSDLAMLPSVSAAEIISDLPATLASQLCSAGSGLPILGGVLSGLACPTATPAVVTPAVAATPAIAGTSAAATVTSIVNGVTTLVANGLTSILGGAIPTPSPSSSSSSPGAAVTPPVAPTPTPVVPALASILRRLEERLEDDDPQPEIREFLEKQKRRHGIA